MKIVILITSLSVFLSNFLLSDAIPSSELFRSPDNFSFKLNPSSKYTAHHFYRDGETDVIELMNIESGAKHDILKIKTGKKSKIWNYYWIDENTMYISYNAKRVFVDLDFEKFEKLKTDYTSKEIINEGFTSTKVIKVKGDILDSLRYNDNEFLFQRKRRGKSEVYKLTTEQLLSNDLVVVKRFKPEIPNAITYDTDNDGNISFGYNIVDSKILYWHLDRVNEEWKLIYTLGVDDFYFKPVGVLSDGVLAVITNSETDLKVVMEYNLEQREFGDILYQHSKYDIDSARISIESKELISVSYQEQGRLLTEYFSENDVVLENQLKELLPEKQFFPVSRNKDASVFILFAFASNDSGQFYWFDAKTEKLVFLNSYFNNHKNYEFTKTELLNVKNKNGQNIEAILTKPISGNGVLIVSPHGGPIGVRNIDGFSRGNQYYASRGYSILNINFRGSDGFGKEFVKSGRGQFGKNIEADISSVVRHVKNKYSFKNTCSMGTSYGGYSSLMLIAQNPDEYDCAIAKYGVYDLPLIFNRSNAKVKDRYVKMMTKPIGEEKYLTKEQSPINLAEEMNVPILLIAGEEDDVAGFEQSNRMKYVLKQFDKDLETMFYTNMGHGYHNNWKWDWHEYALIDDFMRRKLNIISRNNTNRKNFEKIMAEEAMMLSDGFEFKNKVKISRKRSIKYLKIAAESNSPRAMYNLATYYFDGIDIEKDFHKSFSLYESASKLGWSSSSAFLGKLFRDGKLVKKDLKMSYNYYLLAVKQGSLRSKYDLFRAKCSGWGVERDAAFCLSVLENREELKLSNWDEDRVISDVLLDGWNSFEYKDKLLKYLQKDGLFNLSKADDFKAEEFGPIITKTNTRKLTSNGTWHKKIVKIRNIGVDIRIDNNQFDRLQEIGLKIYWSITEKESGALVDEKSYILKPKVDKDTRVRYNVNDKKFNVEGRVKLIIKALDDVVLYSNYVDFNFKEGA